MSQQAARQTPTLWMRHESRAGEQRAPIAPQDVRRLVEAGFRVVVEESPTRIFPIAEYEAAGCLVAPTDTWPDAPADAIVIGLKELPQARTPLRDHIYFAHAYKGQTGSRELLGRFAAGGGTLLDLEYLVDDTGRRVAAFGYWAGYIGAALAVLQRRGELPRPLRPTNREDLDALLRASAERDADATALVIGAAGRSGRGAVDALAVAGITATEWDVEQTRDLHKDALLAHDLLVNTVMVTTPVPPFVSDEDLDREDRALSVISDVTVDVTSDCNVLPINHEVTSWESPVRELRGGRKPAQIIAIDNLPTLLPREASLDYSSQLLPALLTLPDGPIWERARETFAEHAAAAEAAASTGSLQVIPPPRRPERGRPQTLGACVGPHASASSS